MPCPNAYASLSCSHADALCATGKWPSCAGPTLTSTVESSRSGEAPCGSRAEQSPGPQRRQRAPATWRSRRISHPPSVSTWRPMHSGERTDCCSRPSPADRSARQASSSSGGKPDWPLGGPTSASTTCVTGAVLAAQEGATLAELQARLGHTTPAAAMIYQHAASERDKELAERLSRRAAGESTRD